MRKKPEEGREYTSMIAMPAPVGWGDRARPASKGNLRLEKGEIRFERLYVRIFPEIPLLHPPVEDKVIGKLPDDVRRPILPLEEESPGLEPRQSGRVPVSSEIIDYRRPGESDAIFTELLEQIRTLDFRLLAGGIIAIFLGLIEVLPHFGVTLPDMLLPAKAPIVYLAANLILSLFCVFLNRRVFIGGFSSIYRRKPDGDGVISIACAMALMQMAVELVYYIVERKPVANVCGAPLALALLLNDTGLLVMTRRVAYNFNFVARKGVRSSVRLVGEELCFDELRHADSSQRSRIAYCVRTKFLSNYLSYAYEEDFCEQMTNRLTPYVVIPALLAGVLGGLVGASLWNAMYCFTAVMIIGIPCCRMLCLNLPLGRAARRLLRRGAMLNGWASVDEFGKTNLMAVGAESLFPKGTVRLLSVKAFGEEPLDRTVIYAASVVLAAGGPLSQVFEELCEGRKSRVLPCEDVDYEHEMGISGFVEDKPVLVGNREMLRVHGCAMPSKDYEHLLTNGDNRSLVYIAISGVPSAVVLVKYSADADTVRAVQALSETGTGLVVYTCDANVTAKLISRIYCIPLRHISILNTRSGSEYDRLTHVVRDNAPAVLATDGSLRALADGMSTARRLRTLLTFATVIYMVAYGLMLTLTTLLCCLTGGAGFSTAQLMLLQLLSVFASLSTLFRKIL